MIDQGVEWQFGESEEDAVAWMRSSAVLHIYVDFRLADTPQGFWHRVVAVTYSWVQAQLRDPSASHSWPATLIVPDGSLTDARQAISNLLGQGRARMVAREVRLLAEADLTSPS